MKNSILAGLFLLVAAIAAPFENVHAATEDTPKFIVTRVKEGSTTIESIQTGAAASEAELKDIVAARNQEFVAIEMYEPKTPEQELNEESTTSAFYRCQTYYRYPQGSIYINPYGYGGGYYPGNYNHYRYPRSTYPYQYPYYAQTSPYFNQAALSTPYYTFIPQNYAVAMAPVSYAYRYSYYSSWSYQGYSYNAYSAYL